jgi:fructose-bisphosphate aldolase class I
LQEPCLKAWSGKNENLALAQQALLNREKLNSLACLGQYSETMEKAA